MGDGKTVKARRVRGTGLMGRGGLCKVQHLGNISNASMAGLSTGEFEYDIPSRAGL